VQRRLLVRFTPGTAAAKQFYANYAFAILGRNDLVLALPE